MKKALALLTTFILSATFTLSMAKQPTGIENYMAMSFLNLIGIDPEQVT